MSTDKRVIAVSGATGTQGAAVIDALLAIAAEHNFEVRALIRDPCGAAAQPLAGKGCILAKVDLSDLESVKDALRGAWGVFSVQAVRPPNMDDEVLHAENLVAAAKANDVQTFVHTSVARAHDCESMNCWDKPYTWKSYWINKKKCNDAVASADFPHWVVLEPAMLTDNLYVKDKLEAIFPELPTKGILRVAVDGDMKLDHVHAKDVGRVAAAAFTRPDDFHGKYVPLGAYSLSFNEIGAALTRVTGKKVRVEAHDMETSVANGMHPLFAGSQQMWLEDGYQADRSHAAALGVELEDFETFLKENVNKFMIGSETVENA